MFRFLDERLRFRMAIGLIFVFLAIGFQNCNGPFPSSFKALKAAVIQQSSVSSTLPGSASTGQFDFNQCGFGLKSSTSLKALSKLVDGGSGADQGSTITALFIGNSLTNAPADSPNSSYLPMPDRVAIMLKEFGITLKVTSIIQGGAEFADHAANASTVAALSGGYDVVNLQGYTTGYDSVANMIREVKPLYSVAHAAGSQVLFEALWDSHFDGWPTLAKCDASTGGAVDFYADTFQVQVSHAWNEVRTQNPTLFDRLYYDNIHQNMVGDYLTSLVYTRFFTGQSVASVKFIDPGAVGRVSEAERTTLKAAVDKAVTRFYTPKTTVSASIGVSSPSEGQVYLLGPLTAKATAQDPLNGDISSQIVWLDGQGTVVAKGSSLTLSYSQPGLQSLTAQVFGSNGAKIEVKRNFSIIAPGVNLPPQVGLVPLKKITSGEKFVQFNFTSSVTDTDGSVDWASLELDTVGFKGVSVVRSSTNASTIDFNYSNGYIGCDQIRFRVKDDQGAWSAWGVLNIAVVGLN